MSDQKPDHDPEVGDWYYFAKAEELCCIVRIESWSEPVDDTFGEMAMLLFEDGVLWDAPVSTIRDSPHYAPVNRPDDPVTTDQIALAIDHVEAAGEVETTLFELGLLGD